MIKELKSHIYNNILPYTHKTIVVFSSGTKPKFMGKGIGGYITQMDVGYLTLFLSFLSPTKTKVFVQEFFDYVKYTFNSIVFHNLPITFHDNGEIITSV